MKFIRWAAPLALSLAALALSPSAHAAVAANSGDIEVVIGWYWPESQTGADVQDDFTGGVQGGYNFTKHFGLEGSVLGFDSSVNNPAPFADTSVRALTTDLSFEWLANPDKRAVFELYGGPGYAWQDVNPPGPKNSISEDVWTMHVGVGTKISITDNFYIRPDARVRWFDGDNKAGHIDSHTDWQTTVSFGWYIGGE